MRIGFLGPYGTFSQQAAEIYINNLVIKSDTPVTIQYPSISELIAAVNDKEIDEAVVPIENSIEGPVNVTLDMLAWDVDLKIKKEILISVEHHLMKKNDGKEITTILSHPQAIGQCKKFLEQNFMNVPIQYTYSTAQAAQLTAESKQGWAAISAKKAAQEYDLEIIYEAIQDNMKNSTRFIVLGSSDEEKEAQKTSIVFSTQNQPGSLYRILDILSLWDINMTRIESRPAKETMGQYIFFVDIEGHRKDQDIKDALTMIERKTSFFKMLGSYSLCK